MKKHARISRVIPLTVGLLTILSRADAAVPTTMTEQGRLFDQSNVPISANVQFVFSIYSAATGGTALWTETQTLTVSDGYFSAQLGTLTALPTSLFDGTTLYLGFAAGADPEMTPRQTMGSIPYAVHAAAADLATSATSATSATTAVNATGDITPNSVTTNGVVINGALTVYQENNSVQLGCASNNCWTDANGIIGFPGYNAQHGQIAFYPGIGFRFIDSSPGLPADDYGPTPNHIAVYAASFNAVSSRNYKHDIHYLEHEEHDRMLSTINDIKLARYKLNSDADPEQRHIGFIAEELPKEVLSRDHKSVDLYELLTFTVGAMKAQQTHIDSLEQQVKRLQKDLARAGRQRP